MRRVGEHSHRRWGAIGGLWGGGTNADVIVPPPGELFSEINDNSVAILLTYSTTRDLLAGDAKAREEYVAGLPSVHTWRSRAARRDRWRHPRVLEAAKLPSTFDPNLDPNTTGLGPMISTRLSTKIRIYSAHSDTNEHAAAV